MINSSRDFLLTGGIDGQGRAAIVLEIEEGGINTNMVAKLGVLAPYDGVRVAELRNTADHRRIDAGSGCNSQVHKHFMHAIGEDGAQARRLPDVRAEHIG